jgi:hypothetical protein
MDSEAASAYALGVFLRAKRGMRHFVTLIILLLALAGGTRGWLPAGHGGLASVQGDADPHILWTETKTSATLLRAASIAPDTSDSAAPAPFAQPQRHAALPTRALPAPAPAQSRAFASPPARAPPALS